MCDADTLEKTQAPSAGEHVARTITPKLRRISGSENMSGSLRVVNVSPDQNSREQREDDLPISSPIGMPSENATLPGPRSPSVFDIPEESHDELHTNSTEVADTRDSIEERDSYNLKPPPPIRPHQLNNELEALSERFFSADHLDLILKDHALTVRFKQFLKTYRPAYIDVLKDYIEAKKAIAAIEYANAVANRLQSPATYSPLRTARLDERFETQAKQKEQTLVEDALPAYLTHRLVCLVTDTLVKEITGNSAPIMHELIPSLAEVYCISDPSVQDNPIVYGSEEFYNITQYTKEFAIGRNCRFLQGPKSSDSTVARLIQALMKGEECTETILNYKRDGMPFMNLLMIAPLYDNKGAVRYFLGCQIDVSSLIEGGRGVESFAQLLAQYKTEALNGSFSARKSARRDPMAILSDWGQLLTEEEAEVVKNRAQKPSRVPSETGMGSSMTSSSKVLLNRNGSKSSRIILGMEDSTTTTERQLWPAANLGPSGRLPGVYQSYLLVRPYPSLRITFTSPSLRIPGLIQTKFLDRIGGPVSVREGLLDALTRGTGVTAKVNWLTSNSSVEMEGGRTRWLHCTPLFGSDDRVGVWMVVVCEDESAMLTGSLSRAGSSSTRGGGAQDFTSSKLYADYLKREGRESRPMTSQTNETKNSFVAPGDGDDGIGFLNHHFRDF
ncbi:hypothetical protein CBER1_00747 [Cercospora berteroae]|uniref:PAC domain-containing protein n=1 Tax=Cercospora berteroae TaxID=357750 RepID=A0A2S6C9J7_9PEZI|nr:hypothetical protein CBER1_00747 [Cercospora berteroae]